MVPKLVILFVISSLLVLLHPTAEAKEARPLVPWLKKARFRLNKDVSDEFDSPSLNQTLWDEHGIRNPNTGCPGWNGPPSEEYPEYSTFFPTTTHPKRPKKKVRLYKLENGALHLRVSKAKKSFFKNREYYCDKTTFKCNHNASIDCFRTNIFGEPVINKTTGTYAGVNHDKCKIDPHCIGHFKYVYNQKKRTYRKYVSTHLTSKIRVRYGFIETRVWLPRTPIVLAVWMHDDDWTGESFCRFARAEGNPGVRQECPSAIRSRRWQEIDFVEQMNSDRHKLGYTPNIHVFAAHKGEYTSANANPAADGSRTGGGPIIVKNVFSQKTPSFADVPKEQRVGNDFHWGPGIVSNVSTEWAEGWRTVGMYWSPTEIRFYVDGVETTRGENVLVHQPMYLDISHALNVNWAQQFPTDDQIGLWAQVDYLRVWDVQMINPNEVDPPSDLPLQTFMRRKFDDRYGRDMLSVFDRFPYHDDLTVRAVDVKRREAGSSLDEGNATESTKNPANGQSEGIMYGPLEGRDDVLIGFIKQPKRDENGGKSRADGIYYAPKSRGKNGASEEWDPSSGPSGSKRANPMFFSASKTALTSLQKQIAFAVEERNAKVYKTESGETVVEPVENGGQTIFEYADPNSNLKG